MFDRLILALSALILISSPHAFANLQPDYLSLSATQKQHLLWREIAASPYVTMPEMSFQSDGELDPSGSGGHLWRVFKSGFNLGRAFAPTGDELADGRVKVIHMFGSAALVQFVVDGHSPYSGLYGEGAPGLVRLSLAMPLKSVGKFIPGMALKLFVDGGMSKNLTVMEKLEGQDQDHNFFAHDFTNWLPNPVEQNTKMGRWVFERFVKDAIHLEVAHLARTSANGINVTRWQAPAQLIFKPVARMDSESADFRVELAKIPVGTTLYEVYGRDVALQGPEIYIGKLITASEFVASQYEDEKLYFQHDGAQLK